MRRFVHLALALSVAWMSTAALFAAEAQAESGAAYACAGLDGAAWCKPAR